MSVLGAETDSGEGRMNKKLHTVDDVSNAVTYAEFEEDAKRVSDPVVGICGNYPI